ncbi:MAG TPA: hypothetical protein VFS40_10800 [Gemmatimonadales bacterium]|nr:hypothetical protein [Gemmatimonadales bacterium]
MRHDLAGARAGAALGVLAALAAVLLAACGPGTPAGAPGVAAAPAPATTAVPEPCLVVADPTAPRRDTITVVAAGREAAERLLVRQTREVPARIDCEGRVGPGAPAAFRLVGDAPVPASAGPTGRVLLLVPAAAPGPVVRIEVLRPGADPRDALDAAPGALLHRAADVLVTRDPATLAYARRRRELVVVPLPWDRTYVLAAVGGAAEPPDRAAALRRALARDAVRSAARGAEPPFWWEGDASCLAAAAPGGDLTAPRTHRIVYPADDATAGELAERIVALAASTDRPGWLPAPVGAPVPTARAAPLDSTALTRALAAGNEAGYVLPLPRLRPASCAALPRLPAGATLVPLVDTRAHAVVRRGVAPFAVDGDGTLRFFPDSSLSPRP